MDQTGLDELAHRQALAGLRRVNAVSLTARRLWSQLLDVMRQRRLTSLSVLDLACGGGDVDLRLAKMATLRGVSMTLHGWDKSETAVAFAKAAAKSADVDNVDFFTRDVFEAGDEAEYDVVMCTLFLHHLKRNAALQFLERMKTLCRHTVLVDDLYRSRRGYLMALVGCRLLSRSPIVHFDGPASVKAAFTIGEAAQLAHDAGLENARFSRHWPQRFLMQWNQP